MAEGNTFALHCYMDQEATLALAKCHTPMRWLASKPHKPDARPSVGAPSHIDMVPHRLVHQEGYFA